jgi:predicted flap endonuclease-1-like 5' DNA nuclease
MFENVFEVTILLVTGLFVGILISWLYWRGQISEREDQIEDLEASVEGKDGDLKNSERRLKENKSVIENLSAELRQLEETIHDRSAQIREKENSIDLLKGEAANLEKQRQDSIARAEEVEARVAALEARARAMQDNFAILDGIGPRVSEVLRSAGVNTFAKLADTDADGIRGILISENPNLLRLTDPSTWQEQAGLAAEGDWEGLSSLQESLKEGRRARAQTS